MALMSSVSSPSQLSSRRFGGMILKWVLLSIGYPNDKLVTDIGKLEILLIKNAAPETCIVVRNLKSANATPVMASPSILSEVMLFGNACMALSVIFVFPKRCSSVKLGGRFASSKVPICAEYSHESVSRSCGS